MPFHASAIQNLLTPFDLVLLVGGQFFEEVWFDAENMIPKSADVLQIESSAKQLEQNFSVSYGIVGHIGKTLKLLSESLTSSEASSSRNQKLLGIREERERKENQNSIPAEPSPMHPSTAASEVIKALPTNAIVVDESITNSGEVANALNLSRPHQFYAGRGGGIGQGVAGAIGIQIAHPDKPVVCFSGDGSAMYSIQALWSASHHKLPILFIIWANREYRVLKHNLDIYRLRYDSASNNPYPHMDLERPVIDFVAIAKGHGVDAERIDDPEKIQAAVKKAFESGSPTLLEITIAGKNENERKS